MKIGNSIFTRPYLFYADLFYVSVQKTPNLIYRLLLHLPNRIISPVRPHGSSAFIPGNIVPFSALITGILHTPIVRNPHPLCIASLFIRTCHQTVDCMTPCAFKALKAPEHPFADALRRHPTVQIFRSSAFQRYAVRARCLCPCIATILPVSSSHNPRIFCCDRPDAPSNSSRDGSCSNVIGVSIYCA